MWQHLQYRNLRYTEAGLPPLISGVPRKGFAATNLCRRFQNPLSQPLFCRVIPCVHLIILYLLPGVMHLSLIHI